MQIPQLDDATLASVRLTQAHRFPQVATLRPPAPRGAGAVEIKVILGNPSGACIMPAGAFISPAWSQYVLPSLSAQPDPKGLADLIARDMVIWPTADVVDEIFSTWPALSQQVAARLLSAKIGRGIVSDPPPTETPPAHVAEVLAEHPRAAWRWVRPAKSDPFAVVVAPPGAVEFTVFNDDMRDPIADHWKLVKAFVASTVVAVFDAHGLPASLDPVLARWPGVAISLAKDAAMLGGIGAQAELGE